MKIWSLLCMIFFGATIVKSQSLTHFVIPSNMWGGCSPQITKTSDGQILFLSTNIPKGLSESESLKYNILYVQIYKFDEKTNDLAEIGKIDDPNDSDEILDVISADNHYWTLIYHFNANQYANRDYKTYELDKFNNEHERIYFERNSISPCSLLKVNNGLLVAGTKYINNGNINGINDILHIEFKSFLGNNIWQKDYYVASRGSALGGWPDFRIKQLKNGDLAFLSNEYGKDKLGYDTYLKYKVRLTILDSLAVQKRIIPFENKTRILDFIDTEDSNLFVIKAIKDSSNMVQNVVTNYHLNLLLLNKTKNCEKHIVDIENIDGTCLTSIAKGQYLLSISSGNILRLIIFNNKGDVLWKRSVIPDDNYIFNSDVDVLVSDKRVFILGRVSKKEVIGDDFFLTIINDVRRNP